MSNPVSCRCTHDDSAQCDGGGATSPTTAPCSCECHQLHQRPDAPAELCEQLRDLCAKITQNEAATGPVTVVFEDPGAVAKSLSVVVAYILASKHREGRLDSRIASVCNSRRAAFDVMRQQEAIISGRPTAPTQGELDVHWREGGWWLVTREGQPYLEVTRSPDTFRGVTLVIPLDRSNRPCAWPEVTKL